ncbi:hypothetical protein [Curtobacterium sp. MCSS17_016]|uniref:hypothetical protein n=1 Tax=Curtobacterium sp. MCSS17_016 TaxID=2175644 RepID=UPI000DAA2487|nr:hypothetical protein [Curtobacterium sp. MCSS17_016]WIE80964.1 hypothetical protein DEJ19_020825 [Curtobacterium sp. MCSS17_016]
MTDAPVTLTITVTPDLAKTLWFNVAATRDRAGDENLRPLGADAIDITSDEFLNGSVLSCHGPAEALMLQAYEVAAGHRALVLRNTDGDPDSEVPGEALGGRDGFLVATTRAPEPRLPRPSEMTRQSD